MHQIARYGNQIILLNTKSIDKLFLFLEGRTSAILSVIRSDIN